MAFFDAWSMITFLLESVSILHTTVNRQLLPGSAFVSSSKAKRFKFFKSGKQGFKNTSSLESGLKKSCC